MHDSLLELERVFRNDPRPYRTPQARTPRQRSLCETGLHCPEAGSRILVGKGAIMHRGADRACAWLPWNTPAFVGTLLTRFACEGRLGHRAISPSPIVSQCIADKGGYPE